MELKATQAAIFSLTPKGKALAGILSQRLPMECFAFHRPSDFASEVRRQFAQGRALLMICATGIVMRVLAPALKHKYQDPAVIVMDESGRFVVPLLGLHAAGSIELARLLADALNAHCVVTSARAQHQRCVVAGMGCARVVARQSLKKLLVQCLEQAGLDVAALNALATLELKINQLELRWLARHLNKELLFFSASRLAMYHPYLSERSEAVFKAVGCYGVSEAAALCAVESMCLEPGRLWVPKQRSKNATCAIAVGSPLA